MWPCGLVTLRLLDMSNDAKIVLLTVCILVMLGIVMIYSTSAVYAYTNYGDSLHFIKKHLYYLFLGIVGAFACMYFSPKFFQDNAKYLLLGVIVFLIAILVPGIGVEAGGARRWMKIFGMGFQPSELAKFITIVYLADFTSRKRYLIGSIRYGLLPSISVLGLICGLIFLEPDMGTSVAIFIVGFMILFISGVKTQYLIFMAASALPVFIAAVVAAPYRMRRIAAFLDPWKDAQGSGFQLVQSFIALGSGGILGVGLGASKQKLFYLPESHTDFIFAIIGEELGFLGTFTTLLAFGALIWFAFRIAFKVKDVFMSRVAYGIAAMIAFEVLVNIGVSTGSLPTKGLPLPFISYGGSSLVCHLAAIGLLFNISREAEDQ